MALNWQQLYAERVRRNTGSALRDLLSVGSMPEIISLAGGFPAAELFPVEAFRQAMDDVMASDAAGALQYGPSEGYLPLRSFLAERMARFGMTTSPEEVLITTGSQQGLDLLAKLFVDPGSTVVVEDPCYIGGLQAFASYQARFEAIPTDEDGMRVDLLEARLAEGTFGPKLIYVLPNFQNPGGGTLSLSRRRHLLELSYRHAIPLVEDDPYGELRYEGEDLPSLKSLDTEGNVIYLGTFSKILAPGLRVGWVAASREVIEPLVRAKQAADLHSDSLAQRVVHRLCSAGLLDQHVERLKPVYRERRDTMLQALTHHLPSGCQWSRPGGGLFLWVTLPPKVDTGAMLAEAMRGKVAYVPGAAFHPAGVPANTLRLNFSCPSPIEIEEGVRRLGRVANRWCQQKQEQRDGKTRLTKDLAPETA